MTRPTLAMAPALRRAILREARAARPRECCGFLLGRGREVSHLVPRRNVARGPTRYRIADRDHLELRRALRGIVPRLEIVGVYHSHPSGPAWPSATDMAQAHYPEWVYIIAGLTPRAQVRAFVLSGAAPLEVPIRLISSVG